MRPVILIFLVFSMTGFAASDAVVNPSEAVVKMLSYPCDRPERAKFGSGILLKNGAAIYVLSSDHVVFHGNQVEGVCHKAYSDRLNTEFALKLTMVNFGNGLSLLEPVERVPALASAAIAFSGLQKAEAEKLETFGEIAGFPFGSTRVLEDRNAQVLSPDSDRAILPLVHSVIEVNGHNEYGMSGGALFDAQGRYRGLLSHQYLQVKVGKPTTLYETDEGMTAGTLVGLVIPLKSIVAWLDPFFFQGKKEELRWDLTAQLKHKEATSLSGITFSARLPIGLNHGGDPVGVGGEGSEGGKPIEVVLSLPKPGTLSPPWPFGEAKWLEETRSKLGAGGSAVITGLLYQGKRYAIGNLTNLFSKIGNGFVPMIRLSGPFVETDETVKALLKQADEASGLLAGARKEFKSDLEVMDLCESIGIDLDLIHNLQFTLIDMEELGHLIEAKVWTEMMVQDLDLSSDLKSRLLRIQELLKRIKV